MHHPGPGQASDIASAADLLDGQKAGAVLADKAYDSNDLCDKILEIKAKVVILSKRNRKVFIPHKFDLYRHRNRIERCFGRFKHCRRFAIGSRPPHHPLHRLALPRRRHDLGAMNVDPS